MNVVAIVFIFFLWWIFYCTSGSSNSNHDDSVIAFKLTQKWKSFLRLNKPDRELYNVFLIIGRIIGCAFMFFIVLYPVFLWRFIGHNKFVGLCFISFFIASALIGIPIIIDLIMYSIIKRKWKNAILNRFSRWVLIDKDGVKDITLFKMRFMSWQDIKVVGIGNITTKRGKTKPCMYISANVKKDINLSYDMACDELFIVDCRKDIIDVILDFASDDVTRELTPEWYQNAFTINKDSYGKKPLVAFAIYHSMAVFEFKKENYVRALQW